MVEVKLNSSEVAALLTKVFDSWALSPAERLLALGVSSDESSALDAPAIETMLSAPGVASRAMHLFKLYEILHCTNLDRPDLADKWPTAPSEELGGRRPIDMMQSPDGFAKVCMCLDYSL